MYTGSRIRYAREREAESSVDLLKWSKRPAAGVEATKPRVNVLRGWLPNAMLSASSDDAPETASELRFNIREGAQSSFGPDPETGKRRGLRTALRKLHDSTVSA